MAHRGFWKPASTLSQKRDDGLKDETDDGAFNFNFSRAPLAQQRMLLPIYKHRRQILYSMEEYSVVVIVGETGSGKSTQIPQYLYENGWADNDFQIVCTQPRRIAAQTLAQRVSEEVGGDDNSLGGTVGYTVRFDNVSSSTTKIKFVTDGMLLREATLSDPLLSSYSVIMVDEAHERNLNSDVLLGLLKRIRLHRSDLRLIICSATIDAQAFLNFFVKERKNNDNDKNNNAVNAKAKVDARKRKRRWDSTDNSDSSKKNPPTDEEAREVALEKLRNNGTIISVDGRQHVVDILYLSTPAQDYIRATVETAIRIHLEEHGSIGDILCFLPSGEDIDQAIKMGEEQLDTNQNYSVDFLPLYGSMPYQMQARVFQLADNNSHKRKAARRIIFATNIAETSVTVPNITHVIDSGLAKMPYFDPKTSFDRLIIAPISKASARQRAGRSGRVRSGKCYRLYTEQYFLDRMEVATPPEILRNNLTGFILTLKALGIDNILAFDFLDLPSTDALSHGLECLYALGAIDDKTNLTRLGMDMSAFPTEPRVSKMLLISLEIGCSWEVLGVASAMQVRDLFVKPGGSQRQQRMIDYNAAMSEMADPSGDHVTHANLLAEQDDREMDEEDCKEKFINFVALQRAREVRSQLTRLLRKYGRVQAMGLASGGGDSDRSKAIRKCVTAGFFFNVAKLANDGRYYTLRNNILVTPSKSSVFHSYGTSSEYVVFGETYDGSRGGIELRSVSAVDAKWLRELAPHYWD